MKKILSVVICDCRMLFQLYRESGGFDLVVEKDGSNAFVKLAFRNMRVLERLSRIFKEEKLSFVPMMDRHVLYFDQEKVNIGTFLAFLPDYFRRAGYQILVSRNFDQRID